MSDTSSIRSVSTDVSPSRVFHRRSGRASRHGVPVSAAAVTRTAARTAAFASAILSALCAGSITVFSLYGHIFQERLGYTQFQVNGVAIAASIASYLPVPLLGYICDRVGPAPLSLLSGLLFGLGYGLAAVLYRKAATAAAIGTGSGTGSRQGDAPLAYAAMIAAFVAIGMATCAMYLSAVTTCAKNFGRGRHRGLALAAPIAAYGLSGMWQSQFGSRVLYERRPAGQGRGDVDVFAFFLFLAVLLLVVGLLGTFTLRVVDEDELIDEAVEELERSGLLDGSALFSPTAPALPATSSSAVEAAARPTRFGPGVGASSRSGYGTITRSNPFGRHPDDIDDDDGNSDVDETTRMLRRRYAEQDDEALAHRLLDPKDDGEASTSADADADAGTHDEEAADQARLKKQWVLNAETRRFLADHTMWLFAIGFFFMIGPGEAFINNLGTVIGSLQPPPTDALDAPSARGAPTTPATHVSIVGIASTLARLLTGSLTDLLAPRPQTQHLQVPADDDDDNDNSDDVSTSASSDSSRVSFASARHPLRRLGRALARVSVSRVSFLLASALLLSVGLVVLATGFVQNHGERFWIVSGLVGVGYGAVFSLTPIIITVIWGVENFGTNWGIVAMFPALGATSWGLVYSAVYQGGVEPPSADGPSHGGDGNRCYGMRCYAVTFWAMAVSVWVACALVLLAWKGRRGWAHRGVVI